MNTSLIQSTMPHLIVSNRSFEDFRQALRIGQVLNGRVVRILKDEKLLIRLMGYTVVARAGVPLRRGERVTVSVKMLDPMIHLKLAPTQSPVGTEHPDYPQILHQWGTDIEPLSLLLLEQMFLYRLPMKRRTFARLKGLLNRYRSEDSQMSDGDLARAAALLSSLDLPLNQTSLQTLLETQHTNSYDSIDYTV